jgi:hypothetical protein
MRWAVAVLLLFLPAHAGEQEDCGLLPGETYRVDALHLLRPDGTVIQNWTDCYLPVGATLSVGIAEIAPADVKVTRVLLTVTPPCGSEEPWTRAEVPKAKAFLAAKGVSADALVVSLRPCAARPRIEAAVVEVSEEPRPEAP